MLYWGQGERSIKDRIASTGCMLSILCLTMPAFAGSIVSVENLGGASTKALSLFDGEDTPFCFSGTGAEHGVVIYFDKPTPLRSVKFETTPHTLPGLQLRADWKMNEIDLPITERNSVLSYDLPKTRPATSVLFYLDGSSFASAKNLCLSELHLVGANKYRLTKSFNMKQKRLKQYEQQLLGVWVDRTDSPDRTLIVYPNHKAVIRHLDRDTGKERTLKGRWQLKGKEIRLSFKTGSMTIHAEDMNTLNISSQTPRLEVFENIYTHATFETLY